jgi:RNA polymerase sigma-70 factor (sigma-E family)
MTDPAFEAFARAENAALFRTALLMTGDVGLAEDLVQTALARVFARWSRLSAQDPYAYARRVIINLHHDRWRQFRGREVLVDEPPERSARSDPAESSATRDALVRALAELTLRERQIVVLRFVLDLSEADAAAELGVSVGTVKSTASRAVHKLRTSRHLDWAFAEETR